LTPPRTRRVAPAPALARPPTATPRLPVRLRTWRLGRPGLAAPFIGVRRSFQDGARRAAQERAVPPGGHVPPPGRGARPPTRCAGEGGPGKWLAPGSGLGILQRGGPADLEVGRAPHLSPVRPPGARPARPDASCSGSSRASWSPWFVCFSDSALLAPRSPRPEPPHRMGRRSLITEHIPPGSGAPSVGPRCGRRSPVRADDPHPARRPWCAPGETRRWPIPRPFPGVRGPGVYCAEPRFSREGVIPVPEPLVRLPFSAQLSSIEAKLFVM
jgi:hypothetical protein